jgi:hypothetical protein
LLLVLPAKVRPHYESFDYVDLSFTKTMLLRIDVIAIITVLDDSQGALSFFHDKLDMIGGPLSPLQAREIAAHFASINIHLAERTVFSTELDVLSGECRIVARRPSQLMLRHWDSEILGQIMSRICEELLVVFPNKSEILENIGTGRHTLSRRRERQLRGQQHGVGRLRAKRIALAPLPSSGLQHVGFVQSRHSEAFHRSCEIFADFK